MSLVRACSRVLGLGFAVLGVLLTCEDAHAGPTPGDDYYLFAHGVTNNSDDAFMYSTDIRGNLTLSRRRSLDEISLCVIGDQFSDRDVNLLGGLTLLVRDFVYARAPGERPTVKFQVCRSGFPSNFLVMRKSVADAQFPGETLTRAMASSYSLIATFQAPAVSASVASYVALASKTQTDKADAAARIARLAGAHSNEKVYSLTVASKTARSIEEGQVCTLQASGADAEILNAANRVLARNFNNRPENAQHAVTRVARFQFVYKNIDDVWAHTQRGAFPEFSGNNGERCQTYIDFAANISTLAQALSREGVSYAVREYDSNEVLALGNGFSTVESYRLAQRMGVNADQLRDLDKLGVRSYEDFASAKSEMRSSGYAVSDNVYDMMSFVRDRSDGRSIGKTAVFVRDERNRKEQAEAARAKAARESCLRANGYYKTSNSAAQALIAKRC